ncbi:MAG TPA: di-heme oxidoredictase family protein [Candidatus Methylomirabilis sp.]|nr:di-heme oxidoredictase family protein [Candidatus Methylomirabilis sp.]
MSRTKIVVLAAVLVAPLLAGSQAASQSVAVQTLARDPGVRCGDLGAGGMIGGLTADQMAFFTAGQTDFAEAESVPDGLGPRFNLDSCAGCHAQPAVGGTSPAPFLPRGPGCSPAPNPQVGVATFLGARNMVPPFITANGPVREVRFKFNPDGTRDGGVHALFVTAGRSDAPAGCNIAQESFDQSQNIIFRIPTPTFGLGLIEQIADSTILANQAANASAKSALGISGRPNRNGNDGTITRFGWKAQNKSLLLFSGEAYNVEMGITNELFQTEREENPACQSTKRPNDTTDTAAATGVDTISAIEKFAVFMRFLAPPIPSGSAPGGSPSISRGSQVFASVGCALCHTPTLRTGDSTVAALSNQNVNLFSDLLLHGMGVGLADNILQGGAGPGEFRTAPLWGLGQRVFFLHDGRASDLLTAIQAHKSNGSEANGVINNFNGLSEGSKQDLLNFLRSL